MLIVLQLLGELYEEDAVSMSSVACFLFILQTASLLFREPYISACYDIGDICHCPALCRDTCHMSSYGHDLHNSLQIVYSLGHLVHVACNDLDIYLFSVRVF